jgi:hypothetical protein
MNKRPWIRWVILLGGVPLSLICGFALVYLLPWAFGHDWDAAETGGEKPDDGMWLLIPFLLPLACLIYWVRRHWGSRPDRSRGAE